MLNHPFSSHSLMKTLRLFPALALAITCANLSAAEGPSPLVTRKQDELIAVLKSGAGEKDKADVCRELTVVGTADAIPALVALLGDEHLGHMARYALETIPGPAVETALRAQLTQLQGRRLAGVIGSLGVRRDVQAVGGIAKHLSSSDTVVMHAAALSLGRIGTAEAAEILVGAIADPSDPNVPTFAEAIARCAERLAAEGKKDIALQIYDHYNETQLPHQVRAAALRGAVLTRGKDGYEIIREQVRGDDAVLFNAAIRVCYEVKDPELTGLLAAELPKLNADRKIVVMLALGRRGDAAALPALTAAAKTGDIGVRATAIRAMGEIGKPSAIGAYLELMKDPARDIATAAREALAATQGSEADATVLKLFTDADPAMRLVGTELIGRRRMLSAVPALLQMAGGPDASLRASAVKRLGELCTPAQMPALLDLLVKATDGRDVENLEEAVSVVARRVSSAEEAAKQVADRMAGANNESKAGLIRVLTSLGGATALKQVRAAVKDNDEGIRSTAIRSLGAWKTTEAAPDLLELAKSSSEEKTRLLCLRSYLGMAANGDLPANDRLDMCRKGVELVKSDDQKKLLLGALGGIPSMESLELVVPHLDSPVKGEAAAAALAIIPKVMQDKASSAPHLPKLAAALEKVVPAATNPDQEQRAKTMLKQAQDRMK
jgi:HEAT repeat protein